MKCNRQYDSSVSAAFLRMVLYQKAIMDQLQLIHFFRIHESKENSSIVNVAPKHAFLITMGILNTVNQGGSGQWRSIRTWGKRDKMYLPA